LLLYTGDAVKQLKTSYRLVTYEVMFLVKTLFVIDIDYSR